MTDIPLWLVELPASPAALFRQSVIEIVAEPELINVPYCHPLTQEVMIFNDSWVPVLRLHERVECLIITDIADHPECAMLALSCARWPEQITTSDQAFVAEYDSIEPLLQDAAISAVRHNNQVLPILKPSKLFTESWLAAALAFCNHPFNQKHP